MNAIQPGRPSWTALALAWLPVVAWATLVWGLGSDAFSHPETSRYLGPLLEWLWPGLDSEQKQAAMALVRKLAHAGEYGVLALLCDRAVSTIFSLEASRGRLLCLAAALLLAISDESRQALSAARSGSAFDVMLDVAGAALVLALLHGLERRLGRPLWAVPRARRSLDSL